MSLDRTRRWMRFCCLIGLFCVIYTIFTGDYSGKSPLMWIGLLFIAAAAFIYFRHGVCCHCGRRLPIHDIYQGKFCPYCRGDLHMNSSSAPKR